MGGALAGVTAVKGPSDLEGALQDAVTAMVASYDPTAINAVVLLELAPGSQTATADTQFLTAKAPLVRVFTVGPASQLLTRDRDRRRRDVLRTRGGEPFPQRRDLQLLMSLPPRFATSPSPQSRRSRCWPTSRLAWPGCLRC